MDSSIVVLGVLFAASAAAFIVITLLVMLPGRARGPSGAPQAHPGAVWFGGPARSEHGVSESGLVLLDWRPPWIAATQADWPALAEVSEPGRRTGGASAGW